MSLADSTYLSLNVWSMWPFLQWQSDRIAMEWWCQLEVLGEKKKCKLGVLVKATRSVMKYLSRMCLVKVWKLFANC